MSCCLALGCLVAAERDAFGQDQAALPKRAIHVVQHRTAADLAKLLNQQFKGEKDVAIIADQLSNCLLVKAPSATFEQLMTQIEQLDRAPRSVVIEVWVAELKPETVKDRPKHADDWGLAGPSAGIAPKLQTLREKKLVGAVSHAQLSTLEHRPLVLMSGQERSFVASVVAGAGGRVSKSIQRRTSGMLVSATARVQGDLIRLDVAFEDSRPRLRTEDPPLGIDVDGTAIPVTEFVTARLDAQVGIPSGQAILLADLKTQGVPLREAPRGQKQEGEPRPDQVLVIVGARLADAPLAAPKDR
jgi:type II secretory pathway component GspD/PulD (secretin)